MSASHSSPLFRVTSPSAPGRWVARHRTGTLLLALATGSAACGGGGDGGTAPPPVAVASVSVALASASVTVGQSTSATATARDAQGNTIGGKTASWSSSDAGVATVSASGQVSGVAVGTADIVATIDGKTGQATVTVTPVPVASVTVTLNAPSISVGQTTQAAAVTRDAQGNPLAGRTITWSSSNIAVATVSASGLVTGVTAGTANIVATSEGQSGQAALTVLPGVSVSSFTLRAPGGGALDTSNVAGTFELAADVDLPTGFRGVREIKVGSVVVARDSVFGAASVSARVAPFSRTIETTSAVRTITADELRSTPTFPNGRHLVDFTISGQLPNGTAVTRTVQAPIHTRNANTYRLFVEPARRVTLADGRMVETGTLTGRVDIVSFDLAQVNEIEIVRAPAQAVYGANAITGAVSVTTLRGNDVYRPFALEASNYESLGSGTRFLLERFVSGGQTYFPRQAPVSLAGNTPSVDGSGWATPAAAAAGISLSAGLRYQPSAPFPTGVLSGSYQEWSSGARFIDNLAPRATVGFLAATDRSYTVGQRAFDATGNLSPSLNFLGSTTTLSDFLHLDKLQPDLSGLPGASSFAWYAGTSLTGLFQPGNAIASLDALGATPTRSFYLGARAADGAGNVGEWVVATSAGNPYTTGNVVAPGNQLGIAPALWGKLTSAGSYTETGIGSARVYNAAGLAGTTFALQVTGGQYLNNAVFGTLHDYFDRTSCFRGFDGCTSPQVLGGSVNSGTGTLTYSDPITSMIADRVAKVGGNGDGVYAGQFWAGDLGGNTTYYNSMRMGWWGGLVDRSIPTVDGSITVTSIDDARFQVSATDPLGVESFGFAARFDFNNTLFPGGKLYSWIDWVPKGGDLGTGFTPNVQETLQGPAITHGVFFNNTTGAISGSPFPVIGGTVQSRDWAHNLSALKHISYTHTFGLPTFPTGITYKYSLGGTTVCRDESCPAGQSQDLPMYMDVRSPTSTPPITKASFQLIPSAGGAVYHAGTDDTPVTTPVSGGFNHRYEVLFNAPRACIAPGTYLGKVMILNLVAHFAAFTDTFLSFTATGTNSRCHKARRSVRFQYPPPGAAALHDAPGATTGRQPQSTVPRARRAP